MSQIKDVADYCYFQFSFLVCSFFKEHFLRTEKSQRSLYCLQTVLIVLHLAFYVMQSAAQLEIETGCRDISGMTPIFPPFGG